MAAPDIDRAIAFTKLLHAFQKVERVIHVPGEDRWENDVEHSYLLAMLGWYLVDSLALKLDRDNVLRYALAHDLVEIYAGDTYAYTDDEALKNSKHAREHASQQRIKGEFPEFSDLHRTIEQYEARADDESVFVYRLDKLIPVITVYIQEGRTWKQKNLGFDRVVSNKRERIDDESEIRTLFEQIVSLIDTDRDRYFNQ
jgi:5'-deoxynucleotidase YfbR-like HD superfamily hydrolase